MTRPEFTNDDIRMLAEVERKMDAGEVPFVLLRGERLAVIQDVMDELGLESGQTISDFLHVAILQASIAFCKSQIELNKLSGKQA